LTKERHKTEARLHGISRIECVSLLLQTFYCSEIVISATAVPFGYPHRKLINLHAQAGNILTMTRYVSRETDRNL
jgi:hypothetical protein